MSLFDSLKSSLQQGINSAVNSSINGAKSNVTSTIRHSANDLVDKAKNSVNKAVNTKTKKFTFEKLPTTLDELKALQGFALTDYYASAALAVIALNVCATDLDTGVTMIDYLNGPNDFTEADRQFIKMQFSDGHSYIPKSYFKGATPDNNYTPSAPYELEIIETSYSKENYSDGYITLYVQSGGADSPRLITLRNKKSTGEWFMNDFRGLLTSIRIPKEADAWA